MDTLIEFLNYPLISLGASTVTPKLIAIVLVSMLTLIIVTKWLERWGARVLSKRHTELGATKALFQIFRYAALVIGMVVIIQSVGIDLSAFVVVVGTLGIGIGLALQPLLANFVGGLVLLVERPLKIGDRIEIDGTAGRVMHIGARATNIRTNANINVIVPNAQLTSTKIINWSHSERNIRVEIPIGVSYQADPREVERVLLDVGRDHPGVLKDPPTDVLLDRFDDSAVVFVLRVWTEAFLDRPNNLRSELNFAISAALRASSIEIPFPQRDIHIRSGSIGA